MLQAQQRDPRCCCSPHCKWQEHSAAEAVSCNVCPVAGTFWRSKCCGCCQNDALRACTRWLPSYFALTGSRLTGDTYVHLLAAGSCIRWYHVQVDSVTDGAQAQLAAVAAGNELPKAEADALKKRKLIKLE